mmetsp:Transcript_37728/g.94682  ORF Transcript_37728/g.94682 Transcript_37728/m.94682 type:complete len:328 (+) Transcript_37728:264-1247(+)
MVANHGIQGREGPELLLLEAEPLLDTRRGEDGWHEHHDDEQRADQHALGSEDVLWLVPKPRPLEDAGVLRELDLEAAVLLHPTAKHVYFARVDRQGPVLHLPVHEGASRKLHQGHELVKVERRLEVERHNVVPASAGVAVLHRKTAKAVRLRVSGVASTLADANRKVGLLEGDVNSARLFPLLPGQDFDCRLWRDAVGRHLRGQLLLHGAGDIHRPRNRLLDEIGKVLAVVAVEANALEPTVKDRCLVLPVSRQRGSLENDIGQHHVPHIIPDACVHELDTPLLRQVSPHLVPDLFATLVDQVGQVLPSNLVDINVENAAGCGHIPS